MFNLAVGFRRFYLLLWKNFILQVRDKCGLRQVLSQSFTIDTKTSRDGV